MGLIKQNIGDQVYDLLKEKILNKGQFWPGKKVDVSELQQWLQVSETPIRKALDKLSYEGLLEIVPHKGYFYINITEEDIIEVYDLREMFELYCLNTIYERIDIEDIKKIREKMQAQLDSAGGGADEKVFYKSSKTFHFDLLLNNCQNKRIFKFYHEIQGIILLCQHITVITGSGTKDHIKILDCIIEHDLEMAKKHLKIHLQDSKQKAIVNYKNRFGFNE